MTDTLALPPMRAAGLMEISRTAHERHPAYGRMLARATETGRCPVWISEFGLRSLAVDRDPAPALAELGERDAVAVLAQSWPGRCYLGCDCRSPFGEEFPGLTPAVEPQEDPVAAATRLADQPGWAHLAVIPVSRPADIPAAIGWTGMCNVSGDVVSLSAVLRSWEDRFGAYLVRMDRATLWLSVAAPPWTEEACLGVAAEHFACCCDVDGEDPRPIRVYARTLRGADRWRFWWD